MHTLFATKHITDNQTIDYRTIGMTKRATKVAWLELKGVEIKNTCTDSMVDHTFGNMARINQIEIVEIEINIKQR